MHIKNLKINTPLHSKTYFTSNFSKVFLSLIKYKKMPFIEKDILYKYQSHDSWLNYSVCCSGFLSTRTILPATV
jgi:hypothetical protein